MEVQMDFGDWTLVEVVSMNPNAVTVTLPQQGKPTGVRCANRMNPQEFSPCVCVDSDGLRDLVLAV